MCHPSVSVVYPQAGTPSSTSSSVYSVQSVQTVHTDWCLTEHLKWILSGKLPIFIGITPNFQHMAYLGNHLELCYVL